MNSKYHSFSGTVNQALLKMEHSYAFVGGMAVGLYAHCPYLFFSLFLASKLVAMNHRDGGGVDLSKEVIHATLSIRPTPGRRNGRFLV